MDQTNSITDPDSVYRKCVDKQRVVITGGGSKMITALVNFVLKYYRRSFDYISQVPANSSTSRVNFTDAPLIIIEEQEKPLPSISGYHHHIGVIGEVSPADEPIIQQFADATPKGGIIIYSDLEPTQTVGKKERPGTSSLPFTTNLHIIENGKVILISSHQERFPTQLTGEKNLRSINAAKEILKKIGITSEQFYQAISGFAG